MSEEPRGSLEASQVLSENYEDDFEEASLPPTPAQEAPSVPEAAADSTPTAQQLDAPEDESDVGQKQTVVAKAALHEPSSGPVEAEVPPHPSHSGHALSTTEGNSELQDVGPLSAQQVNELNEAVKEYLIYHNMRRTLETFIAEEEVTPANIDGTENLIDEFVNAFDGGERERIVRLWDSHIPSLVRQSDVTAQRLEFYLHIYLAIYPLLAAGDAPVDQDRLSTEMEHFKKYLESRGAELSRTTEFLPFYALPFVPDPKLHPSFQALLSPNWAQNLWQEVSKFLSTFQRPQTSPLLHSLYDERDKAEGKAAQVEPAPSAVKPAAHSATGQPSQDQVEDIHALKIQLTEGQRREARLRQTFLYRLTRMEADYTMVYGMASELLEALAITRTGKTVNERYVTHMRAKLVKVNPARMSNQAALPPPAASGQDLYASLPLSPGGAPQQGQPSPGLASSGALAASQQLQAARDTLNRSYDHQELRPGREQPQIVSHSPGEPDDEYGRPQQLGERQQRMRPSPVQVGPPGPDHMALTPPVDQAHALSPGVRAPSAILASLDFDKVRSHLWEYVIRSKAVGERTARLLQALRWRVTKTAGANKRRVMQSYIRNNILDCVREEGEMGIDARLPYLLGFKVVYPEEGDSENLPPALQADENTDPMVTVYAAWFVNVIASDRDGRAYLLAHPLIISSLVTVLFEQAGDTPARQHALGALQKLSLKRAAQREMMDRGVIKWLSETLRDADALGDYTTEYAAALLMNLVLRKKGKVLAEDADTDILSLLNDLLENENLQVRAYVNGALYSVLSRPTLKERAREMGMGEILRQLQQHSIEEHAKQISYILNQLESEPDAPDDDGNEEDDDSSGSDEENQEDDEYDEDEADDDEGDEYIDSSTAQGPSGEELLCSGYLAKTQAAVKEIEDLDSDSKKKEGRRIVGERKRPGPLQRPTTPAARGSASTPRGPPDGDLDPFRPNRSLNRTPPPAQRKVQAQVPYYGAPNAVGYANQVAYYPMKQIQPTYANVPQPGTTVQPEASPVRQQPPASKIPTATQKKAVPSGAGDVAPRQPIVRGRGRDTSRGSAPSRGAGGGQTRRGSATASTRAPRGSTRGGAPRGRGRS